MQEGHEQEVHKVPAPDKHALTTTVDAAPCKENTPSPTLLLCHTVLQPTVTMIPMIKTKRKKGKYSQVLKKSWKVLTTLVNMQLHIDRQCDIHLIKPTEDPSKHSTYNKPYPQGSPTPMPASIQD